MTILSWLRRLTPNFIKMFLKRRTLPWRISCILSDYLPDIVCVDVGASYYPHVKWLLFLRARCTRWVAVEPNAKNLEYLKRWTWPCEVSACSHGLSYDGGEKTLFVTNVDSGSSLLPPEINDSMKHRILDESYFFPCEERTVETITLIQALHGSSPEAPIFVKLDTQGTELSILQGGQALFDSRRIVGIELESTLLAQPIMRGSGKFWQVCEYLEQQGFELLTLKIIPGIGRSGKSRHGKNIYLNECDGVFALRRDVAARCSVEYRVSLFAFYLTNQLYEEALALVESDVAIKHFLTLRGCREESLTAMINAAA